MWLKGNERTLHHFIKHDGLRLEKCINVTAKHNIITECSENAHNYNSGIRYYFNEICMLYFFFFLLPDPADHGSLHFVMRSCRSWIFKVRSVLRSWRYWILWIWDPKFSLPYGILEILDLIFLLLQWDPGDPGSYFLPWDRGDLGS